MIPSLESIHMNRNVVLGLFLVLLSLVPKGSFAQTGELRLIANPGEVELTVGQSAPLTVTVVDASGRTVEMALRFAAPRDALRVRDGNIQGLKVGSYEIVATAVLPPNATASPPTLTIPITIVFPSVERIGISASSEQIFVGTSVTHTATAFHPDGSHRPDAVASWTISDPSIATVDRWGTLTAHAPGYLSVTARFETASETRSYNIESFPADELLISGGAETARTGDVLHFRATGIKNGKPLETLPVTWAYTFVPDDSIRAPGASAIVDLSLIHI